MNTYRIALINKRCNFRKVLDVKASTCLEAIKLAKAYAGMGYEMLESAYCIEAA